MLYFYPVVPGESKNMKIMFCLLFLLNSVVFSRSSTETARNVVNSWLRLVDNKKYSESWVQAAQLFKKGVIKKNWESKIKAAREPLGSVVSRKELSFKSLDSVPGAPDGEYIVFRFKTSFKNKKKAIETITPMKDPDGKWRVSGYYIR